MNNTDFGFNNIDLTSNIDESIAEKIVNADSLPEDEHRTVIQKILVTLGL